MDILLDDDKTKRKVIAVENVKKVLSYGSKPERRRSTKEDGCINLKVLMEQGRIDILNEPDIFISLKSLQYEYLEGGGIRIYGDYAHIADGIWMMALCMKQKDLNLKIHYV